MAAARGPGWFSDTLTIFGDQWKKAREVREALFCPSLTHVNNEL